MYNCCEIKTAIINSGFELLIIKIESIMKKLMFFLIPMLLLVSCQDEMLQDDLSLNREAQIENVKGDVNVESGETASMIPYHDIDYVVNYKYCPCWWKPSCTSWNGIRVYLTDLTKYWYPSGQLGVYTRNSSSDDWVLIHVQSYSSPNPFINIVQPPSVFPNSGPQYMIYGISSSSTFWPTYPANLLPAGGEVFTMHQAGKKCGAIAEPAPVDVVKF